MSHPSEHQRIVSLDVLRGFALLGILLMNIQSFSMPGATYINPSAFGDFTGFEQTIWMLTHLLADQKFMTLFSLLFGVGVYMFTERLAHKQMPVGKIHARRMLWLLVFGLVHGYLFWYGDVLYSYAVCGLLVYFARGRRPTTLFVLALILLLIGSLLYLFMGFSIPHMPEQALTDVRQIWSPDKTELQKEIAAYTDSWWSAFEFRAEETFMMQTFVFLNVFVWRVSATMMIGMALYKLGFFQLKLSSSKYWLIALTTGILGTILVVTGMKQNLAHDFALEYSMFIGSQFNYWGSILVGLSYASLCMLVVKHNLLMALQSLLAKVGKTAFSNYLLQTLICTTLFYTFGLFGQLDRLQQLGVVLAVWVFQLIISNYWLTHFKFGPMEWLWRALTYNTKPPMRNG